MGAGSFFCVNSNGGIGNPIGRALRKGIALAKERNCEIMFFVDGLQNLDKIISCDKDNYIWLAELRKSLQTQLKGVRISLATKKNRPTVFSGIALIIYGSCELQCIVHEISGEIDTIFIPWTKNERKMWAEKFNAEMLN